MVTGTGACDVSRVPTSDQCAVYALKLRLQLGMAGTPLPSDAMVKMAHSFVRVIIYIRIGRGES